MFTVCTRSGAASDSSAPTSVAGLLLLLFAVRSLARATGSLVGGFLVAVAGCALVSVACCLFGCCRETFLLMVPIVCFTFSPAYSIAYINWIETVH